MTNPSARRTAEDHYRYEGVYNHRGKMTGQRAIRNDGHSGSILNCSHPSCMALRAAPASAPPQACCEPTPDRSGRTCDKQKGHDGDHWTYGGATLTWSAPAPLPAPTVEQQRMIDAAEMLWVVLANVSGGNWTLQSKDWQEVAARWRDNYFAGIKAHHESAPLDPQGTGEQP